MAIKVVLDLGLTKGEYNEIINNRKLITKNMKEILLTYKKGNDGIKKVNTLEYYLLFKYLLEQGYKENEILLVYDEGFLIYNDELYIFFEDKISSIKIKGLKFISLRNSWTAGFYHVLQKLIVKRGGLFSNTNLNDYGMPYKGKLYAISNLYNKRKKLIGDIVIPYNIKSYEMFYFFLKSRFSTKIAIKVDYTEGGYGVYILDLFTENSYDNFIDIMDKIKNKEFYICPYYDFKEEYRVYFVISNGKIKIHSIKLKVINFVKNIDDNNILGDITKIKWIYIKDSTFPTFRCLNFGKHR